MWRDALAACHKQGGDLASIHNIEEQSFIFSQSGYCKCARVCVCKTFKAGKIIWDI